MDDIAIQVLVGLVIYLLGIAASAESVRRRRRSSTQIVAAAASFGLLCGAYFVVRESSYEIIGVTLGYISLLFLNGLSSGILPEKTLEVWFGYNSANLMREVNLNIDANRRLLGRLSGIAVRQGRSSARSLETRISFVPSGSPRYWSYQYAETYSYRQENRATQRFTLQIRPAIREFDQHGVPSPARRISPRADPLIDKWTVPFWPLIASEDWPDVARETFAEVKQSKSRAPMAVRVVELHRREVFGGTDSNGTPEIVEFEGVLELDEEWDTVQLEIYGLRQTRNISTMYFYAQDVCDGVWKTYVSSGLTQDQSTPLLVNVSGITASDISVDTRLRGDLAEVRMDANSLAIIPDDAIVISLSACTGS